MGPKQNLILAAAIATILGANGAVKSLADTKTPDRPGLRGLISPVSSSDIE